MLLSKQDLIEYFQNSVANIQNPTDLINDENKVRILTNIGEMVLTTEPLTLRQTIGFPAFNIYEKISIGEYIKLNKLCKDRVNQIIHQNVIDFNKKHLIVVKRTNFLTKIKDWFKNKKGGKSVVGNQNLNKLTEIRNSAENFVTDKTYDSPNDYKIIKEIFNQDKVIEIDTIKIFKNKTK